MATNHFQAETIRKVITFYAKKIQFLIKELASYKFVISNMKKEIIKYNIITSVYSDVMLVLCN